MIIIALGANLSSHVGTPAETLRAALGVLSTYNVRPAAVSRFYLTQAWPNPSDPPFVNAVARVETARDPASLLQCLHAIEASFGRKREERNAPRTLDLDLIDFDGRINDDSPVLPHPRMVERGFVLVPLADIAPNWRHPGSGLGIRELIDRLPADSRNIAPL
jgi:2-amino-4-hydroxy-6-hydroxymethyldihydropteridine diphosphokinase